MGQGREILQSTVDLVQNNLNLEVRIRYGCDSNPPMRMSNRIRDYPFVRVVGTCQVIYGDTDSIMIHTGMDNIADVAPIGALVKKEVSESCAMLL